MGSPIYPGWPLSRGEIRLVTIRPGAWKDPIECDLHNSRYDRTSYHALSYVWGSRGVSRKILVEDQVYPATVNLERALRYLRNQYGQVFLWIDALCINQEDVEERTHQVGMMDQIYMKCQKVIVFLGDRLEDKAPRYSPAITKFAETGLSPSESTVSVIDSRISRGFDAYEVISLIQQLSFGKHLYEIPAFHQSKTQEGPGDGEEARAELKEARKEEHERTRLFESLRRLMHGPYTPWWNRVWVIQEVTLAPQIDVVHGTMTAPWGMFAKAVSSYTVHAGTCCSDILAKLSRDQVKVLADFSQRVSDVEELRNARYYEQARSSDPSNRTLLSLLRRFRDRQASDARDKVYALLGLVQDDSKESSMRPDYSLNEIQVFGRATIQCIKSTQSFSVFNTELGRKFRKDLPSWVPDWSAPGGYSLDVRAASLHLYEDHTRDIGVCQPLGDDELALRAGRVAKISHVDEVMWGDVESAVRDTLATWWYHWTAWIPQNPTEFFSTICADVFCRPHYTDNIRRTTPGDELKFATWALWSERSPFRSAGEEFDCLWSSAARAWQAVLILWSGREVLDPVVLIHLVAEIVPSGLEKDREKRRVQVKRLVGYANSNLTLDQLIDNSNQFRRNAPWKNLLQTLQTRFFETYSSGINLNIKSNWNFIPTIDNSIIAATLSRRLIEVTVLGGHLVYFGLGPAESAVGDHIFILKCGGTPFVMRHYLQNVHEGLSRHEDQVWWACEAGFAKAYGQDLANAYSAFFSQPYSERLLNEYEHSHLLQSVHKFCKARKEEVGQKREGVARGMENTTWSKSMLALIHRHPITKRPEYRQLFWNFVEDTRPVVYEELVLREKYLLAYRYQIIGDCHIQDSANVKGEEKFESDSNWEDIVLV